MANGAYRTERTQQYADMEALIDYREYDGLWSWRFEEQWLKPRLRDLGYEHIRFFGGTTCDYDGSFRERICELKRPDCVVEYYIYG